MARVAIHPAYRFAGLYSLLRTGWNRFPGNAGDFTTTRRCSVKDNQSIDAKAA
jgi:hypothetical protein